MIFLDYTILICDDDADILNALEIYLRQEGYGIVRAGNGLDAVKTIQTTHDSIHLVLLDIMMPQMDGIQAAVKIREHSNVPIIFLSAKSEDTDRILGLNMGGDDYVTKPFNPVELLARVRAALRRYARLGGMSAIDAGCVGTGGNGLYGGSVNGNNNENGMHNDIENGNQINNGSSHRNRDAMHYADNIYQTGGMVLDDIKKQVTVEGEDVTLTALEYNILHLLISNLDRVFTSAQIYESVWNEPAFHVSKTVSVHIRNIREKIEINPKEPRYLKVVYGLGYKVVKLR